MPVHDNSLFDVQAKGTGTMPDENPCMYTLGNKTLEERFPHHNMVIVLLFQLLNGTAYSLVTPSICKFTSIKIIKNEVGCRDDTVPKTADTRRHCEAEWEHATIFRNPQKLRCRDWVAEDCCMLSLRLAVPSCICSFWHGVIPTSYFIFNDFYTCFTNFLSLSLDCSARRDAIHVRYYITRATRTRTRMRIVRANKTEVVTCTCKYNGVGLNGNRRGGPGSCFLKVRRFYSIQISHHARE